jgi:hypothetical protein
MRGGLGMLWIALALALGSEAHAASIDFAASELRGNTVIATDLGPGQLAIDPQFNSAAPIDLVIVLDAADAGALAWNALVDNLSGEVWSAFSIAVFDADGLVAGSVVANAGGVASIATTPTTATIHFDPAEAAGIDLGAPFGAGADWLVDAGAGAAFRLRFAPVAVPEPTSLLTLAFGIVLLATRRIA